MATKNFRSLRGVVSSRPARPVCNSALLRSDLIVRMFSYIKQKKTLLPQSENEKVMKLLKYYERYWLGQVGPTRLSVFHTEKRTTNDLESFHANLKRKLKSHNPNYQKHK